MRSDINYKELIHANQLVLRELAKELGNLKIRVRYLESKLTKRNEL